MDADVFTQLAAIMEARGDWHPPQAEADIARDRNLSQLRVWNLHETAVRMVPAGERGWTKMSSPRAPWSRCHVLQT